MFKRNDRNTACVVPDFFSQKDWIFFLPDEVMRVRSAATSLIQPFSFKSTTIFLAELKKSTIEAALTTKIMDIAHRKDSVPRTGERKSLNTYANAG